MDPPAGVDRALPVVLAYAYGSWTKVPVAIPEGFGILQLLLTEVRMVSPTDAYALVLGDNGTRFVPGVLHLHLPSSTVSVMSLATAAPLTTLSDGVPTGSVPRITQLEVTPDPASEDAFVIGFMLDGPADVEVRILGLPPQDASIFSRTVSGGPLTCTWDGKARDGTSARSGWYHALVRATNAFGTAWEARMFLLGSGRVPAVVRVASRKVARAPPAQ